MAKSVLGKIEKVGVSWGIDILLGNLAK
jgi:hypothetical protein